MVTKTKFCVDCKHYRETFGLCASPKNGVNLTDGSPKVIFATFNRENPYKCSHDALWLSPLKEKVESVLVDSDPSFFDKLRSWFTNKE